MYWPAQSSPGWLLAAVLCLAAPATATAQTSATLRGVVRDEQRAVLPGVVITLTKPLTGLTRTTVTDGTGAFQLANLPLDAYDFTADLTGFAPHHDRLDLRTNVPVALDLVLPLATQTTTVTVRPEPAAVDTATAGTRHQVSAEQIAHLPATVGSRGLESMLVSFPGFAQNANGAIHPRGAHNQMTFVVDGLPISDQLTGAFANAIDAGIVQSVDVVTGNVAAEFGHKVSAVAVVTSRSGLGTNRHLTGEVQAAGAGFNTWHTSGHGGGGGPRSGYFVSGAMMRTDRFLDQVGLDNLHNQGGFGRSFARLDLAPSDRDQVRLQAMGGRSRFELANRRSQDRAGQDQRQTLADGAVWGTFLRTLDTASTIETTVGYRATTAQLDPSAGDTPVTATQDRGLRVFNAGVRYSRAWGAQLLRAGADTQVTAVRETFGMGITNADFNAPGSATFNPSLLPHDLSRGGVPFAFAAERTGQTHSAFVQTTTHWRAATLAAGVRHDVYHFLVRGQQLQPRVGLAYALPGQTGVLRASYNRNYHTPPNENLLLSSSEAVSQLAPQSVRDALGGGYRPIRPERQHVVEVGYQRALGTLGTLDLSAHRKQSRDQQDNNNFFDTGIIFPTTLAALRVTGAEARVVLAPRRGVSGTLSASTGRATATPPFTGGLFLGQDAVDVLSSGPFAIDHDQRLSVHGTMQYSAPRHTWVGLSVRHDSGLVANPSDPAAVAADADVADLLPYVNLTAAIPRVRPRTLVDLAAGHDVTVRGRRVWSVEAQVTNLTNRTALYNFQSVFVGTRLVAPRVLSVRIRRHF
jgi:Carboxypeptidase regulatory-like domain/TonB-dependent Receptor Plug Domain